MFKIIANPTFKAEVPIRTPGGENQALPVTFKHKTRKEIAALNDQMLKSDANGDVKKQTDLLFSLIEDWEADQAFSRKAFETLIDQYPSASTEIYNCYIRELLAASEGN